MSDASGSFAADLRDAIERRGLGLERIRERLALRGATVSVATLSYWQSGRSLPGRKTSLEVLPELEAVLDLEPGRLQQALPLTRDRARRCPPLDLGSLWPASQADLLARLDTSWDADLDRVFLHDFLRMGPDGRQVSLTVQQVLRARIDGPDRRVVMHCHDDLSVPLPQIRALHGCEVARMVHDEPSGTTAAELVFHAPLRRGKTVIIEYELLSPVPGPADTAYGRRLRLPMREYLLQVEFHPDALPAQVVAYTEERETLLTLGPEHRVHLAHTDATPGITGVRWSPVNC